MNKIVITTTLIVVLALPGILVGQSPFKQAIPGRVLSFPQDHGKHSDFQTEWWYFTGNLQSNGREWGFQLTFFRRGLVNEPLRKESSWAVRDIYPAHFAITDVKNRRFFHTDLISREGPNLAYASDHDLHVRVRDWEVRRDGLTIIIAASEESHALHLELTPEKPTTLHGENGFSRKGTTENQASYYYSFTRLKAKGHLIFEGTRHDVIGSAWMDHEFGSSLLLNDQVGWDWFSLQLDDQTELMLFRLRKENGMFEPAFGTFIQEDGRTVDLARKEIEITEKSKWTSPHSGANYPSGWKIEVPSQGIHLNIDPLVKDQEMVTSRSTRVIYWEGAVSFEGSRKGRPTRGKGYVELTGYAHTMARRL